MCEDDGPIRQPKSRAKTCFFGIDFLYFSPLHLLGKMLQYIFVLQPRVLKLVKEGDQIFFKF